MPKRNLIWVSAILAVAIVTAWVVHEPLPLPPQELEQDGFHCIIETDQFLRENCYHTVEAEALYRAAARGMVTAVDEFSSYVPPEKVEAFQKRMEGLVCATGLIVEVRSGRLMVQDVLVGSPAWRAGIAPGDEIVSIDGRLAGEISSADVENLLSAAQPGSCVALELARVGGKVRPITLRCEEFALETIEGICRDPLGQPVYQLTPAGDVAYVRVCEFVPNTPEHLAVALRQLPNSCGLILDLRGNPGGQFSSAVAVADMFLSEGLIATVAGRTGPPERYSAGAEGTYLPEAPLAVLIDGASASGAEIVAGALKLHGRALLIGTRTRGKPYLQSMLQLPEGLGQVNLTTAEIFLGSAIPLARKPGRQQWGITPHKQVVLPTDRVLQIRRLHNRGAVGQAQATTLPRGQGGYSGAAERVESILALDLQLAEAVRLLCRPETFRAILSEYTRRAASPDRIAEDERTDEHTGH